ncbi:MAG: DNA/RNA nuclease SfsA [Candidatus Bathycorpusculaceae bacterium]
MASFIKIEGKLFEGVFKARLTRFSAQVQIGGKSALCFLPNPGRLSELLVPEAKVVLRETACNKRKTLCDLVGVYCGDELVSVDSRVPNELVFEALKNKDLPEFHEYSKIEPEYSYGNSRFDFLLRGDSKPCLLEVKSCTMVKDGVAMFPDAPTQRGTRHALELAKALDDGYRAVVLFVIQRTDAHMFTSNNGTDPKFGEALRKAVERGVEVYAYSAKFAEAKIMLDGKVEVLL